MVPAYFHAAFQTDIGRDVYQPLSKYICYITILCSRQINHIDVSNGV